MGSSLSLCRRHLFEAAVVSFLVILGLSPHAEADSKPEIDFDDRLFNRAQPEQYCQLEFLKKMGWTFRQADRWRPHISYGNPCQRESLTEAKRAGDLTVELPERASDRAFGKIMSKLDTLIRHPATQCGYKIKLADSIQTGVRKLAANTNYTFRVNSFSHLPAEDWSSMNPEKTCITATGSPSRAIESFYTKPCQTECCIGVQVGYWSGQYELYGSQDFDQAFSPGELTLASWPKLSNTQGLLRFISDPSTNSMKDPSGHLHSKLGHFGFIGLTGAFHNTKGLEFVDVKADHNENFVIVQMSREAGNKIETDRDISKTNHLSEKIWNLSTHLTPKYRENQDLLLGRIEIPKNAPSEQVGVLVKMRKLFSDPFLNGTIVYVHDLKEMSFAEHIARQIKINPRTPYHIRFYPDVDFGVFYERYLEHSLSKCRKTTQLNPP